jgi:uncharacterized protein YcbK (DUF882 family)
VTKNFRRKELECKCGCGQVINDELFLYNLQRLRDLYGEPITISSGFRCPEYNAKVSPRTGAAGPHTIAAVDIPVYGHRAYRMLEIAFKLGFRGIGINQKGEINQRYIHLDMMISDFRPRVWSY